MVKPLCLFSTVYSNEAYSQPKSPVHSFIQSEPNPYQLISSRRAAVVVNVTRVPSHFPALNQLTYTHYQHPTCICNLDIAQYPSSFPPWVLTSLHFWIVFKGALFPASNQSPVEF